MANPLDQVTQDLRDDEGRPLRRIVITGADAPVDNSEIGTGDNRLMRAVAPEPAQGNYDVLSLIKQVKDYLAGAVPGVLNEVGVAGVEPGPVRDAAITGRNSLAGLAGPENDLWPVRMLKSGATLPGEVAQGIVPVVDPETGRTSGTVIERAMDTAGLAGGGALTVKPGTATLGSGPIRQGAGALYKVEKSEAGNLQLYGTPGKDAKIMDPMTNEVKFQDTGPGSWERAQAFHRKNSRPSWDVVTGDTSGYYEPVMRFPSKAAAEKWVRENGDKPLAPGGATLMSDTQKPGAAISGAASSPAPIFYSALEHVVSNSAQDAMSPQQWQGFLKNQPGVKGEELAWTGVEDWLAQQKGKVKKEDVQAYLDEHKVEIKDVTKTGNNVNDPVVLEQVVSDMTDDVMRDNPRWTRAQAERYARDEIRNDPQYLADAAQPEVKYSDYQLPGGENYREHLLTLPDRTGEGVSAYYKRKYPNSSQGFYDLPPWQQEAVEHNYASERSAQGQAYKSSHWDEPNVLAHVRTNERDVGGQPSLHIEEIQSDWHQQGRKQGYKGTNSSEAIAKAQQEAGEARSIFTDHLAEKLKLKPAEIDAAVFQARDRGQVPSWVLGSPKGEELAKAFIDKSKKYNDMLEHNKVPDAPFKTSWPELALKRMIRLAAEEGKTRISWTPGEAQAARYDLSKQVDKVIYAPKSKTLEAFKNGKSVVHHSDVSPEQLPGLIGKDAADRLLNNPTEKSDAYHKIMGDDLKVGGEGMKGFYDNMLPKMVEKLGKAHGVKVKKAQLPSDRIRKTADDRYTIVGDKRTFDTLAEAEKVAGQPVHYFDIPPAWRDQAVGKGFPLYMQGIPFPLTPVDYDPFKEQ